MARRVRSLYRWDGHLHSLEREGWISEATLRAWEYERQTGPAWRFASGDFRDTVRRWKTARPDLRQPEELLVGDHEEPAL